MISVRFQGKSSNITVIQVYAPTINADEAAVDQFYEDPLDLLELSTKKKKREVLFIIEDWNAKVMYMYIVNSMCRCVYSFVGMHMYIHV